MKLENKIIEANLGDNLPEIIIKNEEDFKNLLENSDIVFHEQETEDISSDVDEDSEDLDEEYDEDDEDDDEYDDEYDEDDEDDLEEYDNHSLPNLKRPTEINKCKLIIAKENKIADNSFNKLKQIQLKLKNEIDNYNNKIKEKKQKIIDLRNQEKYKIRKLFKLELDTENLEVLAYDVYFFIKNGIAYTYVETIEKYLKLIEIKDKYNELIDKLELEFLIPDKPNYFNVRMEIIKIKDKIVSETDRWYQSNRKQIEKELENEIVCEEFCSCTSKTTRKKYFENNVKDMKFWCYPYLTDALETIYKKHKNNFK